MGSRLILEGLRQAGEGFDSFGQGLQRSRQNRMQDEALQRQQSAQSEADRIRQELFSRDQEIDTSVPSLDGGEEDISSLAPTTFGRLSTLANQPNVTRQQFNSEAGAFLAEAAATGDPAAINAARQVVAQFQDSINAREAAASSESERLSAERRAALAAGTKLKLAEKKAEDKFNKGQDALDTEFGKDYSLFQAGGGYKGTIQDIAKLREAADRLEKDDDLTGPLIGTLPDTSLAFTNPDALAIRDDVNSVVQKSFKSVLGGSFSQQEGVDIKKTAFNPKLSGATNARRLREYANMLEAAVESKAQAGEYFISNKGTLRGYTGSTDFRKIAENAKTKREAKSKEKKPIVIDVDQVEKIGAKNDAKFEAAFAKIDAARAARGIAPLTEDEKDELISKKMQQGGIQINFNTQGQ